MRRKSFNIPGHAHYLTFSCYHNQPLLTDDTLCIRLSAAINKARTKEEFNLYAYVFMPEHVHLLIQPCHPTYSISLILRSIKGPFTRAVTEHWRENAPDKLKRIAVTSVGHEYYRFWQTGGGYDRNIYTYRALQRAVEYIEQNPVRRKLVRNPEDWRWSSAKTRAGMAQQPLRLDEIPVGNDDSWSVL